MSKWLVETCHLFGFEYTGKYGVCLWKIKRSKYWNSSCKKLLFTKRKFLFSKHWHLQHWLKNLSNLLTNNGNKQILHTFPILLVGIIWWCINPLCSDVNIQILLTGLHTFLIVLVLLVERIWWCINPLIPPYWSQCIYYTVESRYLELGYLEHPAISNSNPFPLHTALSFSHLLSAISNYFLFPLSVPR